jgi:cytochrome c553
MATIFVSAQPKNNTQPRRLLTARFGFFLETRKPTPAVLALIELRLAVCIIRAIRLQQSGHALGQAQEETMKVRHLTGLIGIVIASGIFCLSQENTTSVKHTTAGMTSPSSGKEMFESYCASCHGKDAKGDGPAAGALKQQPADLTTLAKRNGGKFPADQVTTILRGQAKLVAHGDQDMPVWGPVFWRMSQGHEEIVQMRVANLTKYLESLQEK